MYRTIWLVTLWALVIGCQKQASSRAVAVPEASVPTAVIAEVVPEDTSVEPLIEEASPDTSSASFWEHAETLFHQAQEAGTTTASSTADWIAEMYDQASTGTQTAGRNASEWVKNRYQEAVRAGETSATNAKQWVIDDLGKIGTWQYKMIRVEDSESPESELNALGKQRWECFAIRSEDAATVFYLKRNHRSYLRQLPARDLLRLLPLIGGDEAP